MNDVTEITARPDHSDCIVSHHSPLRKIFRINPFLFEEYMVIMPLSAALPAKSQQEIFIQNQRVTKDITVPRLCTSPLTTIE